MNEIYPFMSTFISTHNVLTTQVLKTNWWKLLPTFHRWKKKASHTHFFFKSKISYCLYKNNNNKNPGSKLQWSSANRQGVLQDHPRLRRHMYQLASSVLVLLHSLSFSEVSSLDNCTPIQAAFLIILSQRFRYVEHQTLSPSQRLWFSRLGMGPTGDARMILCCQIY